MKEIYFQRGVDHVVSPCLGGVVYGRVADVFFILLDWTVEDDVYQGVMGNDV